jgi:hypothetical protein
LNPNTLLFVDHANNKLACGFTSLVANEALALATVNVAQPIALIVKSAELTESVADIVVRVGINVPEVKLLLKSTLTTKLTDLEVETEAVNPSNLITPVVSIVFEETAFPSTYNVA